MRDAAQRQSRRKLATYLVIVPLVAVVVTTSYAVLVIKKDDYRLEESDGALIFEIQDLPGGFYQVWDNAFLSIYSGEKTYEGNLVVYPIQGSWGLNSSRLTGVAPVTADFGARDIGGSWFNLTITDVTGDGRMGDGDHLRICSLNGTFSNDTVYFMKFGASAYGGIAPFYIVFGFEFSNDSYDSWVEWGPNETAM